MKKQPRIVMKQPRGNLLQKAELESTSRNAVETGASERNTRSSFVLRTGFSDDRASTLENAHDRRASRWANCLEKGQIQGYSLIPGWRHSELPVTCSRPTTFPVWNRIIACENYMFIGGIRISQVIPCIYIKFDSRNNEIWGIRPTIGSPFISVFITLTHSVP